MNSLLKFFLFAGLVFTFLLGSSTLHAQDADPDPDTFNPVSEAPVPINLNQVKSRIVYPEKMKKKNVTGKVQVKLLIDTSGVIIKHIIKSSPHPMLAEAVEKVIYDLQFSPAIDGKGKKVKFWIAIPFTFSLK